MEKIVGGSTKGVSFDSITSEQADELERIYIAKILFDESKKAGGNIPPYIWEKLTGVCRQRISELFPPPEDCVDKIWWDEIMDFLNKLKQDPVL